MPPPRTDLGHRLGRPHVVRAGIAGLALLATVLLALPQWSAAAPRKAKPKPLGTLAKGKLFGFAGIQHAGSLGPARAAKLIARSGGGASRTVMHWQALEPVQGHYREQSFARYRRLYRALRKRGIKPILMLQFAPAWARDAGQPRACGMADSCHYPPARSMLGEWRKFVAEVVRRFPRAAIEVWNEPNYVGQWQTGVDPERYAELLAHARRAAVAVRARTKVYAGGLATSPQPGWVPAGAFLRRAYAASPSLQGNTDAVNFHVYPDRSLGPQSRFAATFREIRAARDEAGDGRTPLLVSEAGVSTSGSGGVGEGEQAGRIVRLARAILRRRDTRGLLLYTLADRVHLPPHDPERGFGLVRTMPSLQGPLTIEPKPAFCRLQRAMRRPLHSRCGARG
jgi:hypothetical protein